MVKILSQTRSLSLNTITVSPEGSNHAVGRTLYHTERNHQGLGNQLMDPGEEVGQSLGEVQCRERMGGLLRYYFAMLHSLEA